jgi:MFS family permease
MFGMAQSVVNLARMSWLTGAVPFALRARAFSLMGGATRLGLFVGPFLAAAAIHGSGLWAAYAIGAVAMVAAALAAATLPVLPGETAPGAGTAPAPPPRLATMAVAHRRLFATVGVGVLCVSAVRAARTVVIPLWAEHLGLDAATSSVIFGLSSAIDLLVFYPAGKFMDARGRRAIAIPSMAIMGIALVLIPFTVGTWTLLAVALMLGVGNGISSGLIMVLGADNAPASGRAHFLGFWRLIADIGSSVGPAILAAGTAVAGSLAVGVWATSLTGFGAALLLARHVPRTLRSPAERQETKP